MNRQPVTSSSLSSVGYDPATSTLEIEFHHGGIYQYTNVPENVYNDLLSAASKGSYFDHNIKGHYPDTKVS